jgi:hypothetical protein
MGCRAGVLCRALPHGKEFFAMRGHDDTRHPSTHGKGYEKRTAKNHACQRGRKTHNKVRQHGNNPSTRTTKRRSMAKENLRCRDTNCAVRHNGKHDKAPFVVHHDTTHGKGAFAVCKISFLSSFLSILFFLILIFIFSISFIFC